jgi:hypothetical protein
MKIPLRTAFACAVALFVSADAASAQKPKPPAKPEAAPAPAPESQPVVREALRQDADRLATATGAKFTAVVEGKSFDLVGAITPAQAGPILDAAQKALETFMEWTGASPIELVGARKCLIVVLPSRREFQKVGPWFEEVSKIKGNGAATSAPGCSYIWWNDPRCVIATHLKPYDVATVRQVVIHEVGHLAIAAYKYDYNYAPEWLSEGMGAYLEAKMTGVTSCYCFKGGYGGGGANADKLANLKWDKWKAEVKAQAKGTKNLKQIVATRINELSSQDVGKCWSVLDYLISTDPKKFADWLARVKRYYPKPPSLDWSNAKGEAQEKAFMEVYGLDFAGIDREWAAFVAKY